MVHLRSNNYLHLPFNLFNNATITFDFYVSFHLPFRIQPSRLCFSYDVTITFGAHSWCHNYVMFHLWCHKYFWCFFYGVTMTCVSFMMSQLLSVSLMMSQLPPPSIYSATLIFSFLLCFIFTDAVTVRYAGCGSAADVMQLTHLK